MTRHSIKILALAGSLRVASSNQALLRAAAALAPDHVCIDVYEGLGALPLFNPDRHEQLNEAGSAFGCHENLDAELLRVRAFNEAARQADGILVACPEYARGVPGAFKNALDWLVGGDGFINKPFAQFNASPRASHAQAALRITLETMSGRPIEEAFISVPLLNRGLSATAIVSDAELAEPVHRAVVAFARGIELHREELV